MQSEVPNPACLLQESWSNFYNSGDSGIAGANFKGYRKPFVKVVEDLLLISHEAGMHITEGLSPMFSKLVGKILWHVSIESVQWCYFVVPSVDLSV